MLHCVLKYLDTLASELGIRRFFNQNSNSFAAVECICDIRQQFLPTVTCVPNKNLKMKDFSESYKPELGAQGGDEAANIDSVAPMGLDGKLL